MEWVNVTIHGKPSTIAKVVADDIGIKAGDALNDHATVDLLIERQLQLIQARQERLTEQVKKMRGGTHDATTPRL